ncbi:MAG: winged helix-turn-helix domain-containing protein, partial [Chloroflexota bacterium]|nr:winged helix-turn-helix domain-containing protein [Chloroflexota bacterium]
MLGNDTSALLNREGIGSIFLSSPEEASALMKNVDKGNTRHIDLVILDLPNIYKEQLEEVVDKCLLAKIPTLAIVPLDNLGDIEVNLKITEFITSPVYEDELILRARRAVSGHEPSIADDVIVRDDLIINPANYEVTVKGKRVDLRFKEYELLLVLSSNPGRVYDRATLLNQIWGYDYFG